MCRESSQGRRALTLMLLGLLAGCAATTGLRPTSSSILTRQEIDASNAETALEAVQRLRPHFLRGRAIVSVAYPSAGLPSVYMNGVFRGDLTSLRAILADDVEEIHFISPADATTRWGIGHAGGVIHVLAN
jgi:hypothetical protein